MAAGDQGIVALNLQRNSQITDLGVSHILGTVKSLTLARFGASLSTTLFPPAGPQRLSTFLH